MPGPLDGIRVVDVSTILAGPLATMMLADQGADVIKVEPPGIGDLLRIAPFRREGLSAFFANGNRGKRSVALDLKQPRGREVLLRLVERADVFVQNFRPGAVERLGIAESDLRAVRPDLIYVSVSGYGESGPYRDRRVYDPILQGLTGHVAIQKNPDVPIPDLIRHVVVDKAAAYTAAQAITAALFARTRGAGGQHVRVAMIDVALAFLWPDGMMAHTLLGENVAARPDALRTLPSHRDRGRSPDLLRRQRLRDARRLPRARPARTLRRPALRALRAREARRSARRDPLRRVPQAPDAAAPRTTRRGAGAGGSRQLARGRLRRSAGEAQRQHHRVGAPEGGTNAAGRHRRRASTRRPRRRDASRRCSGSTPRRCWRSSATGRRRARCCAAKG